MISFWRQLTSKDLQWLFLLFISMSLVFSKFLLSASMIALGILCLIKKEKGDLFFVLNRQFISELLRFFRHPAFYLFMLFFVAVAISITNTEHISVWLSLLRRKVPYLAMPIIFFMLPELGKKGYQNLLYFFFITMSLASFYVIINYLVNYSEITHSIGYGKAIPTPINHIRFSIFLCFSIFIGAYLLKQIHYYRYKKENLLIVILIIFQLLCLHVFSVRSGLVCFYLTVPVFLLFVLKRSSARKWLWVIIPGLIILPVVLFTTIPSLNTKIDYARYDIRQFMSGEGSYYSDSDRIKSIQTGLMVWKSAPILGAGYGDLPSIMREKMLESYGPEQKLILPHSQWVYILAGGGILGMLLFLAGMYWPLLFYRGHMQILFVILVYMLSISFFVENTIERSYTIAFQLYFSLLFIKYGNELTPQRKII